MRLALQIAQSANGRQSPNPMVGAVIVNNGRIVGMGAHLKAGEAHAEIHALQQAGEQARGGTMYVTLEPCSHYGKTPPCVDAVITKGIKKVVVATIDENPDVKGKGIAKLHEAGIEVEVGLMGEESKNLNEVFFHYTRTKRPFVVVKTASTLDGKIATVTGQSRWITNESSRYHVHKLREQYDAILVGVNTVIADDPSLTVRTEEYPRHPLRIILDSTLRTPEHCKVVSDGIASTLIVTTKKASSEKIAKIENKGVEIIQLNSDTIDILNVLDILGERKITSLLVEGGAEVNGAFLTSRAIQKVISYIACKLVGGNSAPTPFGGVGISEMNDSIVLEKIQVEQIGSDLCIIGYPKYST